MSFITSKKSSGLSHLAYALDMKMPSSVKLIQPEMLSFISRQTGAGRVVEGMRSGGLTHLFYNCVSSRATHRHVGEGPYGRLNLAQHRA